MILDDIVRDKRIEVSDREKRLSLVALQEEVSALPQKKAVFAEALAGAAGVAAIAEIKRRSPSKGLLREPFEPEALARDFEAAGATALSVLTDEKYFGGSTEILENVRRVTRLPILRKDFTIDEYQIWEARKMGADAVLLIAAILSTEELKSFSELAASLGLDALFEVHSERELEKVVPANPKLIGINNRDLTTFDVDLETTARLAPKTPAGSLLISESGLSSRQDVVRLGSMGVKGILVGESLMKEKQVGPALKKLLGTDGSR